MAQGHPRCRSSARNDKWTAVLFSAAAPYLDAASDELRQAFPAARIRRIGNETGALSLPTGEVATVAARCRERPIVFVRHLMTATTLLPLPRTRPDADVIAEAAERLRGPAASEQPCSLQVWSDPAVHDGMRSDELRRLIAARFQRHELAIGRGGADIVLGVCVTPAGVFLGMTTCAHTLTDWPGGRVGLANRPGQISRAALKLEELFKVYPLAIPQEGDALDLGASPGGWTRVLLQTGMRVWAIDPADLGPRLVGDARIHHVRTTAGQFLRETTRTFDLVVNDKRMTADLSTRVMIDAAIRLRGDGLAIMTVKLGREAPLDTMRDTLHVLNQVYEILFARQLFHNRHEVTVVARRR